MAENTFFSYSVTYIGVIRFIGVIRCYSISNKNLLMTHKYFNSSTKYPKKLNTTLRCLKTYQRTESWSQKNDRIKVCELCKKIAAASLPAQDILSPISKSKSKSLRISV